MRVTALHVLVLSLVFPAFVRGEEADFDSAGVKIHYEVMGEGEPIILVHGYIADHNLNWKAPGVMKELAKSRKVIAIDCRGHGKSGKPHDPEKYGAEMAEDVIRLMDHLKIKKAHVAGYSMGAFIACKLLSDHPGRLRSATLGGAGLGLRGEGHADLARLADSIENKQSLEPLFRHLTPEGAPQPSDEQIAAMSKMVLGFNDAKALAAAARGMKGLATPPEKLKGNKVPTLCLMGDLDPLKAGVKPLQEAKPDCEVCWLKGATHMDAFLKPEFAKKLIEFLDKVEAAEKGRKKAG